MAGREEIFSVTGDVSGVLDALDAMESGMLKGEEALNNLASAFSELDTAGAPLAELDTLMGALDEQLLASGFSTKEFDSALGALRDTAGQAAAIVDTLTSASLTDAEAFAALTTQTRALADAQAMAFAALDRATASENAQADAMAGLDTSMASAQTGILGLSTGFENLSSQMALYDEGIATTDDQTVALARSTGIATEEQLKLAEALLRDATFLDADAESVNMLAERYGMLADSMGQAVSVEEPLVQQTLDWASAATEAAAAAGREAEAASQMSSQLASAGTAATTAADDIQQTVVSVDDLLAAGKSMSEIMAMFDGVATGAEAMTVAVQEANTALEETATASSAADSALAEEASRLVAAADAARILAEANTQAAQAALEMATAQGAAADTIGALQVKADAAAAAQTRLAGAEDEAGASAGRANAGFGMSQYMLLMLGMMALSAGKQFMDMGINFDNTMTIIQGKTQASDQQIQQWTATMQDMATQGHVTMDVLAQGLDIVTAAGFRATDATDVLDQGMRLAKATGAGLVESTNLLTASLNAYGQTSASAAGYAQLLFVAIANGKQDVQELTQMLGSTIDTAAAAGISFQDLVNAETLFSRASVDSSIAARNFQTFIAAIGSDSNMTATQVKALSTTFDAAKFATLDWAGKLEMLGKISGNNVAEFNQLIGGADAAKNALAILGISTKQLAENAKAAGLSFDPVLYNSLKTASEKLLYLDQVSGGSEANLKKLTVDGVHPLNDALAALDLKVSDVGAQFAKTHPAFNQTAFDALDLKDKLLFLWDAVGHDTTAFASFIGGAKNLGVAANIMGVDLNNSGDGAKHLGTAVQGAQTQLHNFDDSSNTTADKTLPNLDASYNKTTSDMKSSTDKLGASASALSVSFNKLVDPSLIGFFTQLASAADWLSKNLWLVQGASHGVESQDSLLVISLSWVAQAFINAAKWTYNLGAAFESTFPGMVQAFANFSNNTRTIIDTWTANLWRDFTNLSNNLRTTIDTMASNIWQAFTNFSNNTRQVIDTWVTGIENSVRGLAQSLIGGSIIPDMLNAISAAFSAAGALWNATIGAALSQLEATFSSDMQSIQSTVQSIMTSIGSVMASLAQSAVSQTQFAWQPLIGIASSIFNSVKSTIISVLAGLPGQLFASGANAVASFASGLWSQIGRVYSAASSIAGTVASFLHFSTPEVGPLHEADTFMPHFVDLLARGMQDGASKLQAASVQMAHSAGSGFTGSTSGLAPLASTSSSGLLGQILATLQSQGRAPILGSAPTPASLPSVTQQIGSVNISGVQNLQTLYNQLNALAGVKYENAARGAINP